MSDINGYLDIFRQKLAHDKKDYDARAQSLTAKISSAVTDLNTYCEGLRAIAQQQLRRDFDFTRRVDAYDYHEHSITVSHDFFNGLRMTTVPVVFFQDRCEYGPLVRGLDDMGAIYESIANGVMELYSPMTDVAWQPQLDD